MANERAPGRKVENAVTKRGEQLYRKAFALSQAGRRVEAGRYLREAAATGHGPAAYTLATRLFPETGEDGAKEVRLLLETAERAGLAPAAHLLAVMDAHGLGLAVPVPAKGLARIAGWAKNEDPVAMRQLALLALLEDEKCAGATILLARAAQLGDVPALLALARARAQGNETARRISLPPLAEKLRTGLARLGHPGIALLANDARDAEDDTGPLKIERQELVAIVESITALAGRALEIPPEPPRAPDERHVGEGGYHVLQWRNCWSQLACDHVMAIAAPAMRPSMVMDPRDGRMKPHPYRRSLNASLFPWHQDLVSVALEARLAALAGRPPEHGEMLSVLCYHPGGEYRPHLDALTAGEGRSGEELARNGQRTHTVLIRLSESFEGGETAFPKAGLRLAAGVGDALLFRNTDETGRPDPLSLHAGMPVQSGVKWMATKWIRERRYRW